MVSILDSIRIRIQAYWQKFYREPNTLIINSDTLIRLYRELEDSKELIYFGKGLITPTIYGLEIVETNKENYLKVCLTI